MFGGTGLKVIPMYANYGNIKTNPGYSRLDSSKSPWSGKETNPPALFPAILWHSSHNLTRESVNLRLTMIHFLPSPSLNGVVVWHALRVASTPPADAYCGYVCTGTTAARRFHDHRDSSPSKI
jgi:hypothetical protein